MMIRNLFVGLAASAALLAAGTSLASSGPGFTPKEVKIGQAAVYSGPASAYSYVGRMFRAYFDEVNERGGINGRKVTALSLDDAYSPPKTVEVTRRLVEQDEVLGVFAGTGTPTSAAVQRYLNAKKVPQFFVAVGGEQFFDPVNSPWTISFAVPQRLEGRILGQYVRQTRPDAKIAILYQHDDGGKAYLAGVKEGLGPMASKIVKELSYQPGDPTVDSQIIEMQASGADVFFNFTVGRPVVQSMRKAGALGWRPLQLTQYYNASVKLFLEPAGLEYVKDLVTIAWLKDTEAPGAANDKAIADYLAFVRKRMPNDDPSDPGMRHVYNTMVLIERLLEKSGDDLSRANLLRQATSMKDVELPMLLAPLKVTYTPTDYTPFKTLRLQRFDGKSWTVLPATQ